jgi:hypothetical protein
MQIESLEDALLPGHEENGASPKYIELCYQENGYGLPRWGDDVQSLVRG